MKLKEIRQALDSRSISCRELTQAVLSKIEKENERLNAFVRLCPEEALLSADMADERIKSGTVTGFLDGVPMSLKDNICTKGIETTCCSEILRGWVPPYDAAVRTQFKSAGTVLLGKTNMDEFAMGSSCETSCFGGARNPYDTNSVTGGSSGGSACAVSAGLGAFSVGSDTGGSIRQPAAFCGCVGLKPTYGRVSRFGLIALAPGFDQIGPLASCVEDAAAVYDVLDFHDGRDETSEKSIDRAPVLPRLEAKTDITVGIAPQLFSGAQEETANAVNDAVSILEKNGAKIKDVALPYVDLSPEVYCVLACAQASTNLGRFDGVRFGRHAENCSAPEELMTKTRSLYFGQEVKRRIMMGTMVLSAGGRTEYYRRAQRVRSAISESFSEAFGQCDVIICPTAPTTAFRAGQNTDFVELYRADIFTVGVNLAGLPAISIPCGFDRNGLPIGLQIIGRAFDELTVLNTALAFEKLTDGAFLPKGGFDI